MKSRTTPSFRIQIQMRGCAFATRVDERENGMTEQMNLAMNTHDIADAKAMGYPGVIEAVVALAKETVRAGRCVVIRNGVDHAPIKTIKTMDDLLLWSDELRRADSR